MTLHAWLAGERSGDDIYKWMDLTLVFAETAERALDLARPDLATEWPEERSRILDDETEYGVERYEAADSLATEERVISDPAELDAILRPFGWHYEGERQCDSCDEYSEDVCSWCCCCPGCRNGSCEECTDPDASEGG